MVEVSVNDLRRHKLYMAYLVTSSTKLRSVRFFKVRGLMKNGTDITAINGMTYGAVLQTHSNLKSVISTFRQHGGYFQVPSSHGTETYYEITFDEFAQHVVMETI